MVSFDDDIISDQSDVRDLNIYLKKIFLTLGPGY